MTSPTCPTVAPASIGTASRTVPPRHASRRRRRGLGAAGGVSALLFAVIGVTPASHGEESCEPPTHHGAFARGLEQERAEDHGAAFASFAASAAAASRADAPVDAARARANALRSCAHAARSNPDASLECTRAFARASESLDAVEEMSDRGPIALHLARTLHLLGRDAEAAERLLETADAAERGGAPRIRSFALGDLAEIYAEAGRSEEALVLARRAIFVAEGADAPDVAYRWHALRGRLLTERGDPDAAIEAYRASVASIRRAGAIARAETDPIYDRFVSLMLRRAEGRSPAERPSMLREVLTVLEDQNVAELQDYFRDPCLDAKRSTATTEIPGTLVVYPVLLEERAALVTLFGDEIDLHAVTPTTEELVREIRSFRYSLEDVTSRTYLRHAARLYDWLVAPIEPKFAAADVRTLVFVPRGPLYSIPLAALYDRTAKQFLIEKTPLAITPGLSLTDPHPIDREAARLLAAGISESVQGFTPLLAARNELTRISESYAGELLIDDTFVTRAFEEQLEQRPFGIVHIASHGEFAAESSDSFVLTYDGRITLDRLADLVGKTRFRSQSLELLTLSACESAAGDERAALGLAGVALKAGARSALATLWSVNDEASASLMIEFYRQLGEEGRSRAEALQVAQRSILEQRAYRHPIYWAPYMLVSSWL